MELCPRCNTPFSGRDLCPKDGSLRHPGVVVGERYELDRLIGAGGMGIVYAGRHKLLGKGVAVKVLRGDLSSDAAQVSRFLREAQLCSQLRHESIIDITDFGRDAATGNLYLVMELLLGTSLAEVLAREGELPLERAVPVLRQVCSALSVAHQAGVVHRDLNPRNVFLTEQSGRKDVVKLLDFGISRLAGGEDRITGTGVPIGTTPYMPPEQLRGTEQDHRVDIYAFGVMAYEILTGSSPFKERSPVLLIAEKLSGELPDLSRSALGQKNPGLAQLITECLASSPERRPASAAELEQRLLSSGGAELGQTENLSGMRAGSYRLVRLLGSGGLGSVWLGEHPVIGSRVAIKVLHPQVSESMEVVRRFITEAQAVNRMESPHIVKIFDFGKLPDGRDYAVMELLEGGTLGERLSKQGPVGWQAARRIALQVCGALQAAHQAGVVHRDLKPDNVFLAGPAEAPLVKVLDFGIAKLISGEGMSVHQTQLGLVMGTPLYAAPEQVEGLPVGPAADIYSLGSVLFEMLSGRPPFTGPLHQMLTAKMIGLPPSLAEMVPGLDPAVTELVSAMLARAPEERPTMDRVREVLEGAKAAEIEARPERPHAPRVPTRQWTPGPKVGASAKATEESSIPDLDTIISKGEAEAASARPSEAPDHMLLTGLELETAAPVPASASLPYRPRRSRGLLAASVLFVVAAAGTGLAWLARRDRPQSRPPPAAVLQAPVSSSLPKRPVDQPKQAAVAPVKLPFASREPEKPRTSKLAPPTVILVQSSPSGARVLLRGKEVGKTPVSLRLDPRLASMEIELQKRGYRRVRRVLRAGQQGPVAVQLESRDPAWTDPFAEPAKANKVKADEASQAEKRGQSSKTSKTSVVSKTSKTGKIDKSDKSSKVAKPEKSGQTVQNKPNKQSSNKKGKTKPVLANPFED